MHPQSLVGSEASREIRGRSFRQGGVRPAAGYRAKGPIRPHGGASQIDPPGRERLGDTTRQGTRRLTDPVKRIVTSSAPLLRSASGAA